MCIRHNPKGKKGEERKKTRKRVDLANFAVGLGAGIRVLAGSCRESRYTHPSTAPSKAQTPLYYYQKK
jgi:hypothetical protein